MLILNKNLENIIIEIYWYEIKCKMLNLVLNINFTNKDRRGFGSILCEGKIF